MRDLLPAADTDQKTLQQRKSDMVIDETGQLRPAVEKLLHSSEQYGHIVQEEHYASCIALLRTHIGHLRLVVQVIAV